MRVLFVSDYGFALGGAEQLIVAERAALDARGHRTDLFSLESIYGPAADWTVPYRDPRGRIQSALLQLWHPRAVNAFRHAVESFAPDVIHYHVLTRLSAGVLSPTNRVPAVLTLHDYALLYPLLRTRLGDDQFCEVGDFACCVTHAGAARYAFERLRTSTHRQRMGALKSVLAPSTFVQRVATTCGLSNVVHCRLGVPNGARPAPVCRRSNRIAFVGRCEHEKGVFALLSAFELVADSVPAAELVFAGDGGANARLQTLIASSRHAPRITFRGRIGGDEAASLLGTARLAAVPSLWPEPFGLVGVDAMLAGTPVVGSGRGGMLEWLRDGVNGLIANPDDPAAFAQALISILTDDVLYAQLSNSCPSTAAEFSLERHADELEQVYYAAAGEDSAVKHLFASQPDT